MMLMMRWPWPCALAAGGCGLVGLVRDVCERRRTEMMRSRRGDLEPVRLSDRAHGTDALIDRIGVRVAAVMRWWFSVFVRC